MKEKLRIYSSNEEFTLSDLSELCYNLNNIYKLLVFDKEKNERKTKYYFKNKLSKEQSLFVEKITKESPFCLQLSTSDIIGVVGILVGIIDIVKSLDIFGDNRRRNREEMKEIIKSEFERRNIPRSEQLINETIKLSKREIRIERIYEERD